MSPGASLRILVIEDDPLQQALLAAFVSGAGYEVLTADTGADALTLFASEHPDVVLLDYQLPDMLGRQLVRLFREQRSEWLPILFLSAQDDIEIQRDCLLSGGDDYIIKPFDFTILEAKIQSLCRLAVMQRQIRTQAQQLQEHIEQEAHEAAAAHYLYERLISPTSKPVPGSQQWIQPATKFSGDIICSGSGSNGHHYLLMADATGHGLSAAIGLIPVTQVFHSMTRKGHHLTAIIREMNRQIRQFTPIYRFVAVTLVEIDPFQRKIEIWNGGMPPVHLHQQSGIRSIASRHMALGLNADHEFVSDVDCLPYHPGDSVLFYSDGLPDAEAPDGSRLGTDPVTALLAEKGGELDLADIQQLLHQHLAGQSAHDDVALIHCRLPAASTEQATDLPHAELAADCELTVQLHDLLISQFDLLPTVIEWCRRVGVAEHHIPRLHLVIMELVTNAIDHGLLRLDSQIKESPEGFMRYLELRLERLQQLTSASLRLQLQLRREPDGPLAMIRVEDSGPGFDTSEQQQHNNGDSKSGRGLSLIRQHVESIQFFDRGNIVQVGMRL